MYKWITTLVCCLAAFFVSAQDVQQLRETARSFQRQGDYENAILVLNKALSKEPDNPDLKKDLAITYYVSRNYSKALDIVKPLLERADADEQVFQMAGLIYRTDENFKEADRVYKLGLKKFPQSGLMYSEYGDMLEIKDPGQGNGIKQWEKGIEMDPEYSGNYYHATRYYSNVGNQLWSLLYGEIFVNLESYTGRTTEVKNVLLDAYKKIYVNDIVAGKGKTPFETELLTAFNRQKTLTGNGITAESLTAIRTRFILDWFAGEGKKYPFRLFEMQRQLLKEGLFESYNQWLFGSAENMPAYQNWTSTHATEYADFTKFQQNRLFKVPAGQYYNK